MQHWPLVWRGSWKENDARVQLGSLMKDQMEIDWPHGVGGSCIDAVDLTLAQDDQYLAIIEETVQPHQSYSC